MLLPMSDLKRATSPVRNDVRLDRVLTALVYVALFALYLAAQDGDYVSWDGRVMAGTAKNLVENGRLQTFGVYFPDATQMVESWSQYGIGQSLLLAPFYAIQSLLRRWCTGSGLRWACGAQHRWAWR
jgi:hypothetical protein